MAKARKSKSTKNLRDLRDPLDYPETRIERYLKCIKTGDNTDLPSTVNTRIERYLYCIATGDNSTLPDHPETMIELYLDAIATGNVQDLPHDPQDRLQRYLYAAAYVDSSLLPSADYTRLEKYISSILGGTMFVTDQAPYLFRVSGGDENANVKHKELDTLVGATMAWNQMVSDAKISIAVGTYANTTSSGVIVLTTGHKYFVCVDNSELTIRFRNTSIGYTGESKTEQIITVPTTDASYFLQATGTSTKISHQNVTDLTLMLGPTIADYVYSLESGTAGAGVSWLKSHGFFTKEYYAHDPGSLQSVCVSAHIMRDADDQIIASYPLDHSVTRRGIYKLDANNKLYADGDTDDGKGTETVKYGIKTFSRSDSWSVYNGAFYAHFSGYKKGSGLGADIARSNYFTYAEQNTGISSLISAGRGNFAFRSDADTFQVYPTDASLETVSQFRDWLDTHPLTIVYELATPTTETVETFVNPQQVDKAGTEEYVDFPYFVEDRDVEVPVGHVTKYPQ